MALLTNIDWAFLLFIAFHTLSMVDSSRHCSYTYETGLVKHFTCSIYEFCCGSMCCRSRVIGFYQLWYFWLMLLLMLLVCSGGGWWYRYRMWSNPRHRLPWPLPPEGRSERTQPAMPQPGIHPQPSAQYGAPPSYPRVTLYAAPQAQLLRGQVVPPPPSPYPPCEPPPPYTGPPPSYNSVVGNTHTVMQNANR